MTAITLSGKQVAAEIRAQTAAIVARLTKSGVRPQLAVVVANDDGGSAWYVSSLAKAATKVGIACDVVDLGATAKPEDIHASLIALSNDNTVHGIILQTPLPRGAILPELSAAIKPTKDVDGASPASLGRLAAGLPAFAPATAQAVMAILDHYQIQITAQLIAVVGRSNVVGKPLAHLLLNRNATVTICHSHTQDLAAITSQADIVVVAVGSPALLTAKHVKTGAIVIDVGTNPTDDGGLIGDVDQDTVRLHAGGLTPVPGGVGPVTTALLLHHTAQAADTV